MDDQLEAGTKLMDVVVGCNVAPDVSLELFYQYCGDIFCGWKCPCLW
jgi:hypothetical protein